MKSINTLTWPALALSALTLCALVFTGCRDQQEEGKPTPVVCSAEGNCPPAVVEQNQEKPLPVPEPIPKAKPIPVETIAYSFPGLSDRSKNTLTNRSKQWADFGHTCPGGYPSKPSAEQPCDDGDSVIFNGLLCFSGNAKACESVGKSQDADGRWWRSPRRAAGEGRVAKASFSRDQMIGVVYYLITLYKTEPEQAREKATNWHNWIKANGNKLCTGVIATCDVVPLNWTLIARLFEHLKLPLDDNLNKYLGQETNKIVLTVIQLLTKPGFELHNYAATALAFAEMGLGNTMDKWMQAVKSVDGMEDNPFIDLVGKMVCAGNCGIKSTLDNKTLDQLATKVLQQCPNVRTTKSNRSQWGWERKTEEKAWENSMGWDCVFMANLLKKASARSQPAQP